MNYAQFHHTMRDLYRIAPPRIRFRAKDYLSEDRIESLTLSEEGILEARVKGNNSKNYDVLIDIKSRTRKCNCPAHHNYRNIPCKHEVLVVLPFIGTEIERM